MATILMLVILALLVGGKWLEKMVVFLWTFAFWDLFYYLSLYLLIKWPPSLTTIDVLFLIPRPWIAPVQVPIGISSITIIIIAVLYLSSVLQERQKIKKIERLSFATSYNTACMAHFVRPNFVYAGNVKYIKAGNYIETACDAVGIADRTYERWNKEGLKIEAKCFNNEDEKIESEWQKITEMEKAKCRFCRSIKKAKAEATLQTYNIAYTYTKSI